MPNKTTAIKSDNSNRQRACAKANYDLHWIIITIDRGHTAVLNDHYCGYHVFGHDSVKKRIEREGKLAQLEEN